MDFLTSYEKKAHGFREYVYSLGDSLTKYGGGVHVEADISGMDRMHLLETVAAYCKQAGDLSAYERVIKEADSIDRQPYEVVSVKITGIGGDMVRKILTEVVRFADLYSGELICGTDSIIVESTGEIATATPPSYENLLVIPGFIFA